MTNTENSTEDQAEQNSEGRLLPGLAWVCGSAAIAIAGALGVAVLGATFGLWSFGIPLSTVGLLLRWQGGILGSIIFYLGWLAFLGGSLLMVLAILRGQRNLRVAAGVAMLGGILLYPAYTIPVGFATTAQSAPPIHDVSTDTVNPPIFVAVLPLREGARNRADFGAVPTRGSDPAKFDETGFNPEMLGAIIRDAYPDLKSVPLTGSEAETFGKALQAAEGMGWEIVDANEAEGRIEATATTPWLRFKDDVVIRLSYHEGGATLDARSVSRVGGSDVGKNAARLRDYISNL